MPGQFLMGNKILALAAQQAGAKIMFGYPITPASEILETWVALTEQNKSLSYLQTEDEMAAGFGVIGACLAGVPAFTATAGPGNVLMQDAFSMAEALRIPTVAMIIQRGGLSTSTVIYSQEEVRLTCFGGNGEGFRIVYSPANLQELHDYTFKAFENAWQYRFPAFILADGYQGKMKGVVSLKTKRPRTIPNLQPILKKGVNLRNCYNLEEEIGAVILQYALDYQKIRSRIEEFGTYQAEKADYLILAHGIVAAAAQAAIDLLRKEGVKIGLFRPITLRPFPKNKTAAFFRGVKKIFVLESALGQLSELYKKEYPELNRPLIGIFKPALGFTPNEIKELIKQKL